MVRPQPAGEDIATRRRRLRYRAWHRGTQEMDLVLGPYADAYLEGMDAGQLDRLEGLMEEEDTDLLKWVMGQEAPPARIDKDLLDALVVFIEARARIR